MVNVYRTAVTEPGIVRADNNELCALTDLTSRNGGIDGVKAELTADTAKRRPVKWTYAKLKPWFGMTTNVRTISNSAFDKLVRERSGR